MEPEKKLPPFNGDIYCVKCKEKKAITGAAVTLHVNERNGKQTYMAKSVCPDSGTKMNRIIGPTWPKES